MLELLLQFSGDILISSNVNIVKSVFHLRKQVKSWKGGTIQIVERDVQNRPLETHLSCCLVVL